MKNLRQDYRHPFPPTRRLSVELRISEAGQTIQGEIVNLSIGGMAVVIKSPAPKIPVESRLIARLGLSSNGSQLSIPSVVVHVQNGDPPLHGFRFVPPTSSHEQEARDKILWSFLLEEQRRDRLSMMAKA
jgi:c-di-GMP-binding flagellar brake protein YcgR